MAGIVLSTVGAKVAYAVETTAGTRPTTGYVVIDGLIEAPDVDLSTDTLDASTLADTITRYIPGRQDPGAEKVFSAFNTKDFRDDWDTFVSAVQTGLAAGKETHIAYIVEGDTEAFFWTGVPLPLGHGGLGNNDTVKCSPKIICTGFTGYETKPTIGAGT